MFAAETTTLNELKAKLEALKETRKTVEIELASVVGRRERLEAMEQDRDLILESYATLAPEALVALSPKERCKVYVILNLTVEAFAGGSFEDKRCVRRGDPGLGRRQNVKTFRHSGKPFTAQIHAPLYRR